MKQWIILFCIIVAVFAAATLLYVLVSAIRELLRHKEPRHEHYIEHHVDVSSTKIQNIHSQAPVAPVTVEAEEETDNEVQLVPAQVKAPVASPKPAGVYDRNNPCHRIKLLAIAGAVYALTGALVWRAASIDQDED